jgi:(p)ppGpp synthase/HD superfamily hydrolase
MIFYKNLSNNEYDRKNIKKIYFKSKAFSILLQLHNEKSFSDEILNKCFQIIDIAFYKSIKVFVKLNHDTYKKQFLVIKQVLEDYKSQVTIKRRIKHVYSIARKLIKKTCELPDVSDIHAIRVIVKNKNDVKPIYELIKSRLSKIIKVKNYLHNPKKNGYDATHVITDLFNTKLELQIISQESYENIKNDDMLNHFYYKLDNVDKHILNNLIHV